MSLVNYLVKVHFRRKLLLSLPLRDALHALNARLTGARILRAARAWTLLRTLSGEPRRLRSV